MPKSEGMRGRIMVEPALGGAPVTFSSIVDWTLGLTKGTSEANAYEEEWATNLCNAKSWSGSAEGYWFKEIDTDPNSTAWQWFTEAVNATYEFRMCYFYPNADDSTRYWYGYAAMTSFNPHPEIAGAVRFTMDIIGGSAAYDNRGLYFSTIAES